MANSMQHWNGNQLCAIDTETGGFDPFFNELLQICVLPLDSNCDIREDVVPFYVLLRPNYPERIEKDALRVNKLKLSELMTRGFDQDKAIDLFEEWVKTLGLPCSKYGTPKKIIPLGQNYSFDMMFIKKWLGWSQYDEWFHYHYKDTMQAASYLNDRAAFHGEKVPYSKLSLKWLCNKLNVKMSNAHDALSDCISTAEVYKKLLMQGLF